MNFCTNNTGGDMPLNPMIEFYKNLYMHLSTCHPMFFNMLKGHTSPMNDCNSLFPKNMNPMQDMMHGMNQMMSSCHNPMMGSNMNPMMSSCHNPMMGSNMNPMMSSCHNPMIKMMGGMNPMMGMMMGKMMNGGCCVGCNCGCNKASSISQSCSTKTSECNAKPTSCCSGNYGDMQKMLMNEYTGIINKLQSFTEKMLSEVKSSCGSFENKCPTSSMSCLDSMQSQVHSWVENFGKFHGEMIKVNEQAVVNMKLVSENIKLIQQQINENKKSSDEKLAGDKDKLVK